MNYLQLCQRLRKEVGASGDDSTTVDAAGEWDRLCTWVSQAYLELQQERPNWNWMRVEVSFDTINQQNEYPYASAPLSLTNFSRWRENSFRIFKDSVGDERLLDQWGYNDFRDAWLISTDTITYAYPHSIAVSPTDSLILALPPDGVYTVTGEYFKAPTELADDSDEPSLPPRFHMLIVYRAMQDYGFYEAADEVVRRAIARYAEMMERMLLDEIEGVSIDRGFI